MGSTIFHLNNLQEEGCKLSIYHCSIKIISRSGGRSAVASAAYRSGEKLYNDETGLIHDFTHKGGVVMSEIILPANAPKKYMNREILWNEVQQIEKRSDAQFAREVEVALPVEMSRDEQIESVRDYIRENFVNKGMIADWALHDKEDGNPHVHIMLTVRGFDVNEKWMNKQKTVFANALNGRGNAIYNPDLPVYDPKNRDATSQYRIPRLDENGNQKTRVRKGKGTEYLWEKISIPENDWNDRGNAEIWRESWAKHCNRYLEREYQIDHRSYVRQGVDMEPTIHEGVTARNMGVEGKVAERCMMNREIKERNFVRQQMKVLADELTKVITEKARAIYDRFKEFRRSLGDAQYSGRDDKYIGKSTKRNRNSSERKFMFERTVGRIHELKRAANGADKEAENTDRQITETDNRIAELKQLTVAKEKDRDERLKKLRKRRASYNVGRDAGSDRGIRKSELRSTAEDISAFIRELDANERASEEKRNDSILERASREAVRERSHIEAKRAACETKRRTSKERTKHKAGSQSYDFSR